MAPYSAQTFPEPESAVLTAVVVLIPLGSITATASMHNPKSDKPVRGASGSRALSASTYSYGSETLLKRPGTSYSLSSRSASVPQPSPTTAFDRELNTIDLMEMDDQKTDLEAGIRIERGYSVTHAPVKGSG